MEVFTRSISGSYDMNQWKSTTIDLRSSSQIALAPPPCPGLLITVFGSPCHPTVAFSLREYSRWTLTRSLIRWCVPLRAARLSAHSGFIQTRRGNCWERKTQLQLLSVKVFSVSIGDRKTPGDLEQQRNIKVFPAQFTHGDTGEGDRRPASMGVLSSCHLWWYASHFELSLGARSALPQHTSSGGSVWEGHDGSAARNSSVVHYRWVSLRLVHVCNEAG